MGRGASKWKSDVATGRCWERLGGSCPTVVKLKVLMLAVLLPGSVTGTLASQPGQPLGLQGGTFGTPPLTHEWHRHGLLVTGAVEPLLAVRDLAEGAAHKGARHPGRLRLAYRHRRPDVSRGLPGRLRGGRNWADFDRALTKLTRSGPDGVFTGAPPTNRFYRAEVAP